MRKIPTLFLRDPDDMSRILNEINPDAAWVLDGDCTPTRKYDGTCMLLDDSLQWWGRREVKPDGTPPPNYWAVETDPTTGKTVGWEPINQSTWRKAWQDAINHMAPQEPGTYELCGPKINKNPEGFEHHILTAHAKAEMLHDVPLTREGLREYLRDPDFTYEGIVWHEINGPRMAKLKKRDFPTVTLDDVAGLFGTGWTGGMDPVDWVRSQRD